MSANDTAPAATVKLPKAVMMQVEKSNQIVKERMEARLKETTESPTSHSQLQTTPESTPTTAVAPVAPAPVTTTAEPEKDAKYWEHRFKTSQGMFEAEKTRLRTQISELTTKQGGFEAKLEELQNALRAAERLQPTKVDLKKYLTEEQIDTYGPDVLQSVVKVASNAAEETLERRLKEEIARQVRPVQEELKSVTNLRNEERESHFWDTIQDRVPDWSLINDTPKFHEWLGQKDPLSGSVRQQLLSQAQSAFDPDRVVALFEAFKQVSPAPKTPDAVTQHRVVPDPVGQTAIVTNQTPEAPFVKTSEIAKFYDDCKLQRYRYRPQEKEAFERKIREAQLAGRIIKDTK